MASFLKKRDISGTKQSFATIFYQINNFHEIILMVLRPKGSSFAQKLFNNLTN